MLGGAARLKQSVINSNIDRFVPTSKSLFLSCPYQEKRVSEKLNEEREIDREIKRKKKEEDGKSKEFVKREK